MIYKFICPSCGRKEELDIPITEYRSDGHMCECGAELVRDPDDFCKTYHVNCFGMYADYQSK